MTDHIKETGCIDPKCSARAERENRELIYIQNWLLHALSRRDNEVEDLRRQLAGLKDEIRVIRDRLVGPGGVMDCVVAAERVLEKK